MSLYANPWRKKPKPFPSSLLSRLWKEPHSCDLCKTALLEFRGERGRAGTSNTNFGPVQIPWSVAKDGSDRVFQMYAKSQLIKCEGFWRSCARQHCRLAEEILDRLEIPPDSFVGQEKLPSVICRTDDGVLSFESRVTRKRLDFAVDILTSSFNIQLRLIEYFLTSKTDSLARGQGKRISSRECDCASEHVLHGGKLSSISRCLEVCDSMHVVCRPRTSDFIPSHLL